MFCPNCGTNCHDANFCPKCGTPLAGILDEDTDDLENAEQETEEYDEETAYPPLSVPLIREINGVRVDLNKVVKTYGTGARSSGGYAYLQTKCGISYLEARMILEPVVNAHKGEKNGFLNSLRAEFSMREEEMTRTDTQRRERKKELDSQGVVYCPKCLSTSVSAGKKGFSFGRAAVASPAGLDAALLAGGLGSKKVMCTCLKCGYKWQAGKK